MVSLVRVLKNGLRCPVAKSQLNPSSNAAPLRFPRRSSPRGHSTGAGSALEVSGGASREFPAFPIC
jgi:hypothetical protein